MYQYQSTNEYFAQIADGLEDQGVKELSWLGATQIIKEYRGLKFKADKAALYRVNYKAKLLTRVLAPLASFHCHDQDSLYKNARAIDWSDFLSDTGTFAIFANVSESKINNSHFASLKLKDAIVDQFRDKTGQRPNIDTRNPDIWFNLHIRDNQAVISVDTSGGSMHRRGYRKKTVDAPMQETVAAAIIELSEWDGEQPFYDPMCGSGTLLCEALMYASNIPAGYLRSNFGFTRLPDFDQPLWWDIQQVSRKQIRNIPEDLIAGSDILKSAVSAAKININLLPGGKVIQIDQTPFEDIGNLSDSLIICNPPYGIRLDRGQDMGPLYKRLGDFLKFKCQGSTAYIYFGDRELIKKIGLRPSFKIPLRNGGLDGRLVKYELY
ncbi:MAG: class I SAM-dependent RNA methyltransferase [Proteobacteria bacterium]|nr:class I SAM-dependent RNA methyltransferase [Pseudomonadota bacterium]